MDARIEAAARALVGDERYEAMPARASYLQRKSDPSAEWHDRTELHAAVSSVVAAWNRRVEQAPDAGEVVQPEPAADLVERVRQVIFSAFASAEPDHPISKFPLSYIATFDDMARAVIALFRPQMDAAAGLLEACERANAFIKNGVGLGFIRMPDAGAPDPAHETPGIIRAAIAAAKAAGIGGNHD